jgi:hypothetical protein
MPVFELIDPLGKEKEKKTATTHCIPVLSRKQTVIH